jgi:hypothetical protein
MKTPGKIHLIVTLAALAVSFCAVSMWAQNRTLPPKVTSDRPIYEFEMTDGEVIYVSGDDIVVKTSPTVFELLTVPPDFQFHVDGKHIDISELKPGMKLTQRISTVTTPREVTTIRTVNGKVWYQSGNRLILEFPDNTHKQYTVPDRTVFNIDGQEKSVFDLRKGMNVSATVVTVAPEIEVSKHQRIDVAPPSIMFPPVPMEGALLIETPNETAPAPVITVNAEPAPQELPQTASLLPLFALVGAVVLGVGVGLGIVRKVSN